MAVSSIHVELDKFFHETRGLNKDNCWEWFESFRNTLLYKGYEENPHPYAMYLLDEMECYSAYCAVGNIEGRVVAELERKKEPVTYEAVYNICIEKKGEEYLNLKEKESRYIEAHPEANKWKSNGRRSAKSSSTKQKEGYKKDAENPESQATEENSPKRETARRNGTKPFGKFGNVYITDDEYAELGIAVGNQNDLNMIIDALGASLEDGSRTSTNHYATLTKWVQYRKDKDKEKEERQNTNNETFAEREGKRCRKILEQFGMIK